MTTREFIASLESRDIRFSVRGDKLSVNAPDGALTPELRSEIGARKDEILEVLSLEVLSGDESFTLRRSPVADEGPLSFAQQRLWFLHQLNPQDVSYNLAVSAVVPTDLSHDALRERIFRVVLENPALRTVFSERDGVPYQKIIDWKPELNIRAVSENIRSVQYDIMRQPFDLSAQPAVRFELLQLSDGSERLLVPIHHIISDAWSLGLLISRLTGKQRQAPDFQYLDFAYSEQKWFAETSQEHHREYWGKVVRAPLPSLELPTRSLSNQQTPESTGNRTTGDSYTFTLDSDLTKALLSHSRAANLTLYSTLLGVFKTLLFRYSGQKDIIVGTPVTNRDGVELEHVIGIFINTIVVRSHLDGDMPFKTVARDIHNSMLDAFEHKSYPFEKIVELGRPERSLTQTPLFRTGFILNNTPRQIPYDDFSGGSIFDVSLYINQAGADDHGLEATLEYNTALFDPATIHNMADHFVGIARSIAADFSISLKDVNLLSANEQAYLDSWKDTDSEYPRHLTTTQLIEQRSTSSPSKIAVYDKGGSYTYAEIDSRAAALARSLVEMDVPPGSLVGICLDRTVEMIIATLATWKAGCAYVPLDPAYPLERLTYMAEDARLAALITENQFSDIAVEIQKASGCRIISVDDKAADTAAVQLPSGSAADLAYVIYTSGSTGKPKGVKVTHQSLVNLLVSMQREPGLTVDDTLFSVTTLSFDIAGLELFLPLITGASVVIASREALADPRALEKHLKDSGATVIQGTPSTWRFLLDAGWKEATGLKILCGGEALPRSLADAVLNTGAELWNVYGPTETTIWSTVHRVSREDDPIPIGRPVANTSLYVLDENLKRVPVGITGELFIGGECLSPGYLFRDDLTHERFVPDPFEENSLIYRTGDQVRFTNAGTLEYIGRLDNQVKIRGFRIEPGEIESILETHPDVAQVVVIAREDTPGDPRLVAYIIGNEVIADGAKPVTTSELRRYLAERVPPFMIPASFVQMEEFPHTPNGKVDKKALPAPLGTVVSDASSTEDKTPQTPLELTLTGIWESILGVKNIGRNDNFFELGGNSLLGIRLLSAVEKVLHRRVPVAVIFQGQTVAEMAETLNRDSSFESNGRAIAVQPKGYLSPLFFVPGVNGNVIGYEELAQELGTDRPLYGLQSVGLQGESDPLQNLSEIASTFIEDIRAVQPEGPYHLMGFCIGGMVAFELAQQLSSKGEQIAYLGLIDTWPQEYVPTPKGAGETKQQLSHLTDTIRRNLKELAHPPAGNLFRHLKKKIGAAAEMAATRDVYRGDDGERLQDLVIASNQIAASTYEAHKYEGKASFYITLGEREIPDSSDPRVKWVRYAAPESELRWIPGLDSGSLLKDPYLKGLASALKHSLTEAG